MSDFKDFTLDFDISTPVRRLVARPAHPCPAAADPAAPATQTAAPAAQAAETAQTAPAADRPAPPRVVRTTRGARTAAPPPPDHAADGAKPHPPARRGLRVRKRTLYLLLGCAVGLWLLRRPARRSPSRALRAAKHACTRHPPPATTATCQNHCAGGTCVAEFATLACADAVRSAHFHYPSGAVRRVPALYQRVPNTTLFFTGEGDRVTFQPAECAVRMGAVVVHAPETDASARLRSHLVWIAAADAKTFRILRGDDTLVATVDAHLVEDTCAPLHAPTYCVYKLEMQCHYRDADMHVFAVDHTGAETRANTFVYC